MGSYLREETANFVKSITRGEVVFFSGQKVNTSTLKEASNLTLSENLMERLKGVSPVMETLSLNGDRYAIVYYSIIR